MTIADNARAQFGGRHFRRTRRTFLTSAKFTPTRHGVRDALHEAAAAAAALEVTVGSHRGDIVRGTIDIVTR
jgi:hypothetical protein